MDAQGFSARIWAVILGVLLCLLAVPWAGAQPGAKNILVVYSFADRREFSAIDALKSGMRAVIPGPINFYVENLESRRFDDRNYESDLAENLKNTYGHIKLDLVVADNFPALEFILRHRNEMFPGTPIVFFDLDEAWMAVQKKWPGVTGVTAPVDVGATVDLALRLHPSANTIAVLFGDSPYERYWLARIHSELVRRKDRVREIDLIGLSASDLMQRIDQLPSNSIVLFQLSVQETSQPAIEVPALAEWIGQRLPTYSIFPWYCINHQGIGGDTYDGYQEISLVSALSKRVLSGERPDNIPVVHDAYHHIAVDWRSLARWNLPESAFPKGTEFVYRQPTAWEIYRKYILTAIALIVFQAVLIAALLWQRERKRKAEAVLRDSEERFRVLANTTPSLIWMCDAAGKITYLNDHRFAFTGSDPTAGYGDSWVDYVHADDLPKMLDAFSEALRARKAFSTEYRIRRTDGVYRWMLGIASPRLNDDGSFAGFIGSAIDTTDQKLAKQTLERLSGQLIEAQEKERSRIARELHDDICQKLAVLSIELDQASRSSDGSPINLEDLQKQCAEITDDVQALSHRLHSSKLDYLGLVAALRGFCEEFSKQHGVSVKFTVRDVSRHLPKDVALCLFRVAQEALHNAVKYSQTTEFAVDLMGVEDGMQLEVRDRGAGFDVEEAKRSRGLGLVSMQERVHLVHGRFSIESKRGEGTRIMAVVPIVARDESSPGIDVVREAQARQGIG